MSDRLVVKEAHRILQLTEPQLRKEFGLDWGPVLLHAGAVVACAPPTQEDVEFDRKLRAESQGSSQPLCERCGFPIVEAGLRMVPREKLCAACYQRKLLLKDNS